MQLHRFYFLNEKTMPETSELTDEHIGKRVEYHDWMWGKQSGRIKSYNNEKRIAFVVYNCNSNRDADHRKDYTAQSTSYDDIVLI